MNKIKLITTQIEQLIDINTLSYDEYSNSVYSNNVKLTKNHYSNLLQSARTDLPDYKISLSEIKNIIVDLSKLHTFNSYKLKLEEKERKERIREEKERIKEDKLKEKERIKEEEGYKRDTKINRDKNNFGDLYDKLSFDKNGFIKNSISNIKLFLSEYDGLNDKIRFNSFNNQLYYGDLPLTDGIISGFVNKYSDLTDYFVPQKFQSVLSEWAGIKYNSYNPLIDYLNSLTWDGKSRLETVFTDWFKADDTPLNREFAKKWFIGAIKRGVNPGCKFDSLLLLKGNQGNGKSTFCERLARGFGYANNINISEPKEYVPILFNNWIIGIDERTSLSKKDQNEIKQFITNTEDSVRLPYGKNPERFKRKCVFIGSTNDDRFLNDYSEITERRYWIVECRSDQKDGIYLYNNFTEDVVDQLWAEAFYLYKKNPNIELNLSTDLLEQFSDSQKQYKTFYEDFIYEQLDTLLNEWHYNIVDFSTAEEFSRLYTEYDFNKGCNTIDIVPTKYIKYFIEVILKRKTSPQKIKTFMEALGFRADVKWYKGTNCNMRCWIRTSNDNLNLNCEQIF